jgi:hypothetical protein
VNQRKQHPLPKRGESMMSRENRGGKALSTFLPISARFLEPRMLVALSILLSGFLFLAGCAQQSAPQVPTSEVQPPAADVVVEPPAAAEESYPPLPVEVESNAYPIATPVIALPAQGYPSPDEMREGILFAINTPLRPGDTEINGVGPAGLTVFVVNVTLMGDLIGSGQIGDDGTFRIAIPALEPNFQIGLFADLEAAGIDPDSVVAGPGARVVPLVGFFYDTALVQEQ